MAFNFRYDGAKDFRSFNGYDFLEIQELLNFGERFIFVSFGGRLFAVDKTGPKPIISHLT